MSAFQLTTFVGIPLTVVFVATVLLAFARPDRDPEAGLYAAYLALAGVLSLYLLLLGAAALGEAVTARLVIGAGGGSADQGIADQALAFRSYFSIVSGDTGPAIAGFATLVILMAAVYGYHTHHRSGLARTASGADTISGVDRAYRGAVCFAMLSLIAVAALIAGASGHDFFAAPVTSDDRVRDLAMGSLLSYGGLVLVAGLIFRVHFGVLRGSRGDVNAPAPTWAELDDA